MYDEPSKESLKACEEGLNVPLEQGEDKQALHSAIGQVRARALTLNAQAPVPVPVPVPSPCISICRMSASGVTNGLCQGCFRTRDEIAGWSRTSDESKRSLWKTIEQRMAALVS